MEAERIESELFKLWQSDWNCFARDVLKVKLDSQQQSILRAIQSDKRVSVRAGTARGKDYVAAVAAICFLYLNIPSKVICTGPTGRQVNGIMLSEIKRIYKNAAFPLGGRLLSDGIKFTDDTWYLLGFKSDNNNVESWSGFHSPNLMVICTEASGITQTTFNSIEGLLQGNSRLLLIFNPNVTYGEAYQSTRSSLYTRFRLNCLDAPNVVNYQKVVDGELSEEEFKKNEIPGQIDWHFIQSKIIKGWAQKISKSEAEKTENSFKFNHEYYLPNNLFRIKILGEFASEGDDNLIPVGWVESAFERWKLRSAEFSPNEPLKLGVDVAGMGRDVSAFAYRFGNFVQGITPMHSQKSDTIHMELAGKIINILNLHPRGFAFIDTIGEGAGVHSRLSEQGFKRAISCKFSYGAGDLTDVTGEYRFANMRAYLYWALRDALNPAHEYNLALPPDDDLLQGLTEIRYKTQSNGSILIEAKEDIRKRLGRSLDLEDALANTFYPESRYDQDIEENEQVVDSDEWFGF